MCADISIFDGTSHRKTPKNTVCLTMYVQICISYLKLWYEHWFCICRSAIKVAEDDIIFKLAIFQHFNNSAGFCSKICFGVFNGYSGPGAFHTRHAFPYSPSPIRGPTMSICFFSVGLIHLPMDKMATTLADDSFNYIFLNENDRIWIQFPLKFVPRSPMDNKPALVQIMAWHRTGDKPLPEPTLNWFTDASMWH